MVVEGVVEGVVEVLVEVLVERGVERGGRGRGCTGVLVGGRGGEGRGQEGWVAGDDLRRVLERCRVNSIVNSGVGVDPFFICRFSRLFSNRHKRYPYELCEAIRRWTPPPEQPAEHRRSVRSRRRRRRKSRAVRIKPPARCFVKFGSFR